MYTDVLCWGLVFIQCLIIFLSAHRVQGSIVITSLPSSVIRKLFTFQSLFFSKQTGSNGMKIDSNGTSSATNILLDLIQ